MRPLLLAGAAFAAAFLAQWALWKVRLPRRQVRTLLLLQFGALGALLAFARPEDPVEAARLCVSSTALILAWMITYTAVEADSPSLVIARRIAESGAEGVTKEELLADLGDEKLVLPRLADMLVDRMAVLEDGRYALTPKGRLLARIFAGWRAALGLGMGG